MLLSLLLVACARDLIFSDHLDATKDLLPALGEAEELATPYVLGAEVRVEVDRRFWAIADGWSLESDDPDVFTLGATAADGDLEGDGVAVGVGETDLVVRDERSKERGRTPIEVRAPDGATLEAHGPMLARVADDGAPPRVLEGGTATWLLHWLDGETELHGNGVLDVGEVEGLDAAASTTVLGADREWVVLTGVTPGAVSLPVRANGELVTTVEVEVVPAADVASLELLRTNEAGEDGEERHLVARGRTFDGRPVDGLVSDWSADGASVGTGDAVDFAFRADEDLQVTATWNGLDATTMVHAETVSAVSSNAIGCAAVPGRAGLGVLLLAAAMARRRGDGLRSGRR